MFRFVVEYFDSIKGECAIDKGFVGGSDFTSAAKTLEDFYGDELCSIEKLYPLEDVILDNEIEEVFAND